MGVRVAHLEQVMASDATQEERERDKDDDEEAIEEGLLALAQTQMGTREVGGGDTKEPGHHDAPVESHLRLHSQVGAQGMVRVSAKDDIGVGDLEGLLAMARGTDAGGGESDKGGGLRF
jgi:hypothetical protein